MAQLHDDWQHATPEKIVRLLQDRGMMIDDRELAEAKIDLMGYARLRMYEGAFCGSSGDHFKPGTTFDALLRIHDCDRDIRFECFRVLCDFEILLRNSLSEALSKDNPYPYDNSALFVSKEKQDHINTTIFWHNYKKYKDHPLVEEFDDHTDEKKLPPIWAMKETLGFGQTFEFYKSLKEGIIITPKANEHVAIEKAFGFTSSSKKKFGNWVSAFQNLRNECAHNQRIFDHKTKEKVSRLTLPDGRNFPAKGVQINKLVAVLQCLDYVMQARGADSHLEDTVKGLAEKSRVMDLSALGF